MIKLFFLLLFSTLIIPPSLARNDIFNVLDFGAVGNGLVDDAQGFKDAWEATCSSSSSSPTMLIPSGRTFLLTPSTFQGNCKCEQIHVQIDGQIIAPENINQWKCHDSSICENWILFYHVNGLFIHGSGSLDGRCSNWWEHSKCNHKECGQKPTVTKIKIIQSNNVHISNLKFLNSPKKHIFILESTWVYISNVEIHAPPGSPNTDGDDCISIGPDTSHINVNNIKCGPGHGIRSIGKYGKGETIEHVSVKNVELRGTTNGVRIKTWQGGKGYIRDVLFEKIQCIGARNPIIIDQFYCDSDKPCENQTSAVKISNVRYNHVYGTSNKERAVVLARSETVPCTDISLKHIDLTSSTDGKATVSYCLDAYGESHGEVVPNVLCFHHYSS
ncbi:hypothetical protein MKW98_017776 [Papaver atlanticum]|uniref:Polygalacturonase n=1 Tax=Papaver atlanticum TaxID=357466 RepID=A0AAD4TEP1_9MAGN|nr:hypothetical protein MKW98_017776 [Papaver atlanticum]